uniref:hypothetical protein n=1 Tax=Actinosynnema sp. TaxID=1872144 RepID=UPI003F85E1E3
MVGRPYRPHDSRRARSTSPAVGVVRAPVAGPAFRATSSESGSTTVTIADAGTENCLTALESVAFEGRRLAGEDVWCVAFVSPARFPLTNQFGLAVVGTGKPAKSLWTGVDYRSPSSAATSRPDRRA